MKFRTFKYNIIRAIKVINHAVNAETMKMLGRYSDRCQCTEYGGIDSIFK